MLNRAVDGAKPRGNFYLPWIVGLVGLILLLLLFRSCVHEKAATTTAAAPAGTAVVAQTSGAPESTALSGLGGYLAGTGTTPRTFTFDKLHFDTNKADVRASDLAEVNDVAGVLKQYGQARVKIAGYADARGSDPTNEKLGQARADAVRAALVKAGIDGGRIEAVSGGANDAVATNDTTQGQQANRRTELVVVSR
nr:OmpA family protein [Sphingomonas bacterium]